MDQVSQRTELIGTLAAGAKMLVYKHLGLWHILQRLEAYFDFAACAS